jgi:hypothetical protein
MLRGLKAFNSQALIGSDKLQDITFCDKLQGRRVVDVKCPAVGRLHKLKRQVSAREQPVSDIRPTSPLMKRRVSIFSGRAIVAAERPFQRPRVQVSMMYSTSGRLVP